MFYPVVEEYAMQNRQRELAKDLEIRRQMRNSLESKSDDGPHFFAEAGGRLRNLVRRARRQGWRMVLRHKQQMV